MQQSDVREALAPELGQPEPERAGESREEAAQVRVLGAPGTCRSALSRIPWLSVWVLGAPGTFACEQAGAEGLGCLVKYYGHVQERPLREPLSPRDASPCLDGGPSHTAERQASPTEHREGLAITGDHDPNPPQTRSTPVNEQGKHCTDHVTVHINV